MQQNSATDASQTTTQPTDQVMGRIGLFTVLKLIAGDGLGYVELRNNTPSTLLSFLNETDPKMHHCMLVQHEGFVRIWRRKEYNESIEKQRIDELRIAAAYEREQDYQADREVVMKLYLEMCEGDRKMAEKLFAAIANNPDKLKAKAKAIRLMKF